MVLQAARRAAPCRAMGTVVAGRPRAGEAPSRCAAADELGRAARSAVVTPTMKRQEDGAVRTARWREDVVRRARLGRAAGADARRSGGHTVLRPEPRSARRAPPRVHAGTARTRTHPGRAGTDHAHVAARSLTR